MPFQSSSRAFRVTLRWSKVVEYPGIVPLPWDFVLLPQGFRIHGGAGA